MSQEQNWEKMESLIEKSLKKYLEKPTQSQTETKTGSGESHKTLTEMLNCPNCVPDKNAFREAFHSLMGEKKCKDGDCGVWNNEEREYCEHCGEEL